MCSLSALSNFIKAIRVRVESLKYDGCKTVIQLSNFSWIWRG